MPSATLTVIGRDPTGTVGRITGFRFEPRAKLEARQARGRGRTRE